MSAFPDHFSAASPSYASFRPTYPDALCAALAALIPAPHRVWEAGCGSGQLSVGLASHVDHVEATDASAAQIASATAHPRVRYTVAPAESCGLADRSAGLVVVAQAAHWFELTRFYAEVQRVAPGGVLVLISYDLLTVDPAVDAVVNAFYTRLGDGFWPPERSHVEDGYARLPFPFERVEVGTFAMTASWGPEALIGYVDTWSAVRALERAGQREEFERFAGDLRAVWAHGAREVVWPLTVRAGRVPELGA